MKKISICIFACLFVLSIFLIGCNTEQTISFDENNGDDLSEDKSENDFLEQSETNLEEPQDESESTLESISESELYLDENETVIKDQDSKELDDPTTLKDNMYEFQTRTYCYSPKGFGVPDINYEGPAKKISSDDCIFIRTFNMVFSPKTYVYFQINVNISSPAVYARIFREGDTEQDVSYIHGTNTGRFHLECDFKTDECGIAEIHYPQLNLLNGQYFFHVGILKNFFSTYSYDQKERVAAFTIRNSSLHHGVGIVYLKHTWKVSQKHVDK